MKIGPSRDLRLQFLLRTTNCICRLAGPPAAFTLGKEDIWETGSDIVAQVLHCYKFNVEYECRKFSTLDRNQFATRSYHSLLSVQSGNNSKYLILKKVTEFLFTLMSRVASHLLRQTSVDVKLRKFDSSICQ